MPKFGVNINNREPLLTEKYSVSDMVEMADATEELGYDSVWVGDNLLERPRIEPISLLSVVAGRTDRVKLGTACMITPLRNPVQFAQAWTSLDMLSDGRTILGACMGSFTPRSELQYEVVGVPPKKRATVLEEGLKIMKSLWNGEEVNFHGDYFDFEGVAFDTGREVTPFVPVQDEIPIHVVSNPGSYGKDAVIDRAVRRIVDIGGGWMTCCRADHPDEYEQQIDAIGSYANEQGKTIDDIDTSYQVTVHIADSQRAAEENMNEYLSFYYPSRHDPEESNLYDWGPIGTADDVIEWLENFSDLGCDHFVMRFGSFDQFDQLERFSEEVLPSF